MRSSKEDSVQELADSYNFIAVTERFDESLVHAAPLLPFGLSSFFFVVAEALSLLQKRYVKCCEMKGFVGGYLETRSRLFSSGKVGAI